MKKTLLLLFIVVGFSANAQSSDSLSLVKTIDSFIHVFSNLEWDKFRNFFSEDATAFFPPSSKFPFRANNKGEVEKIFKQVFENARNSKGSPPYLDIQPKETKIQILDSMAIVSFLLDDPELVGRRTVIFRKYNSYWLIVHLHASGAAKPNK